MRRERVQRSGQQEADDNRSTYRTVVMEMPRLRQRFSLLKASTAARRFSKSVLQAAPAATNKNE